MQCLAHFLLAALGTRLLPFLHRPAELHVSGLMGIGNRDVRIHLAESTSGTGVCIFFPVDARFAMVPMPVPGWWGHVTWMGRVKNEATVSLINLEASLGLSLRFSYCTIYRLLLTKSFTMMESPPSQDLD